MRFPVVDSDAAADWLAEGDDIDETDPNLGECVVTPTKVGALVKISNELIADSAENTQAAGVVGDGLVRQFARAIDLAFFSQNTHVLQEDPQRGICNIGPTPWHVRKV